MLCARTRGVSGKDPLADDEQQQCQVARVAGAASPKGASNGSMLVNQLSSIASAVFEPACDV